MQPQQKPSAEPFAVPDSVTNSATSTKNSTTDPNQSMGAAPEIADDGDLIEKEWVAKVKQIVSATKHDPALQNQQLTELKVEYLKKRYGKVIKDLG